jgi:hypothetical protein
MAAQLIPRGGLQLYSLLGVGPLPTQGPTTLYTHGPRGPQYKNSLTILFSHVIQKIDMHTYVKQWNR